MPETANPFLSPSDLPYELPPFAGIEESHYLPAFEHGIAEQLAEIDAIADDTEAPTFENTIVALELTGRTLERVSAVFFNQVSSHATPGIREIESEIAPRLAEHRDAIFLHAGLFARVQGVVDARPALDATDQRLLERYHLDFVRAGAALDERGQKRLREINTELSELTTRFNQNLTADTNESAIFVDDPAQLDGLSDDAVAAAAETARQRGHDDGYVLTLILPSGQPSLTSLTHRDLRERVHRASTQRGDNDNEHNNRATIARIVQLRAERAALLGYADHASYVLEDSTAGSPQAVHDMLDRLTPAAVANAKKEAAPLKEAAGDVDLRPWDWAFYSDRVRRARYEIDEGELRPYLELERVLHDGVFYAANRLYGLSFAERHDLDGYLPGVRVFEVFDEDGSELGLFVADYYARETKRGGAWMNSFVDQSHLLDQKRVVVNNLNITKPADGEPTLLTFDEVNTMFHEFGHALHGLFSDVRYPRFSGTSVMRDFVEYPSQVNEMWAVWPEVLANYAKHYRTGEPIPQELVHRLVDSQQWGEGFKTTEYLGATLLDLAWHELAPGTSITADDVEPFEAESLVKAGVAYDLIPPRYRSTYFAHVFSGGYSAGYYSYIWSEVLDADSVEWFKENGGLLRENGDHFRRTLLSKGGSVDAMQLFRDFRGRDPRVDPLLERRGLTRNPA